ncbi:methionine--tRNA ligase, mitochondrial isoform X1 [Ooceraea biroi]|uniref:methionine--tRNA ligase, mitochondrial isoform X1 n=1 Tax=Ooceraea biroi TaxID=2015173 RepID=UPI00097169CB|nr:methionine--tRNA ligase, mitochondrial isoform X1 [Ooceraea biroi]
MASVLLRNVARIRTGKHLKDIRITVRTSNERYIMTGRARLEKVLEELQKNPYYDKYAEKIAKMQQTSPEEFLQRVDQQEKMAREKKVKHVTPKYQPSKSTKFSFLFKNVRSSWSQTIKRQYVTNLSENKYITTPIFYVNAGPHIGHLYSAILADAVARYNSMFGHKTFLATGTDEHGNKVKAAAAAASLSNYEYCTNISQQFKEMCDRFEVDYSRFIRTTEKQHCDAVHHFWRLLEERGHIYLGNYSGWYCVSDEAFLSDSELVEQKDPSGKVFKVSADSGNLVEWMEEKNYKFRLSAFQNDLKYWLKDGISNELSFNLIYPLALKRLYIMNFGFFVENTVRPALYHKMLSQWVEEGTCLQDLSISRVRSKVPWAIPSPYDESQSIYVWMDALVNYLTALGYPNESFKEFWPPTIQIIGKDILKFHGVYWPAFLIAAGLEPPRTLLCHAHWIVDRQKMSKSKGNVISPFEAANDYTEDGLRYFILREAVLQNDANYSSTKIINILNSELADTLGNLVSRCTGKTINPSREFPDPAKYWNVLQSQVANEIREAAESAGRKARENYEEYNLHHVVDIVMNMLHCANRMVTYHEPWQLRKQVDDAEATKELKAVISLALESSRIAALILYPIIPRLSSGLLDFLNIPKESRTWANTAPEIFNDDSARKRCVERNNVILFKKIRSQ